MKKFACQYAIDRFLPYMETGEFANVGIVMLCPDAGFPSSNCWRVSVAPRLFLKSWIPGFIAVRPMISSRS